LKDFLPSGVRREREQAPRPGSTGFRKWFDRARSFWDLPSRKRNSALTCEVSFKGIGAVFNRGSGKKRTRRVNGFILSGHRVRLVRGEDDNREEVRGTEASFPKGPLKNPAAEAKERTKSLHVPNSHSRPGKAERKTGRRKLNHKKRPGSLEGVRHAQRVSSSRQGGIILGP